MIMRRLSLGATTALLVLSLPVAAQDSTGSNVGRVASSTAGKVGQRLTRNDPATPVAPMARIANRVQNRIQNRLRTRLDRVTATTQDATTAFTAASNQARTAGRAAPR